MKLNLALTYEWPDGSLWSTAESIQGGVNIAAWMKDYMDHKPDKLVCATAFPSFKKARDTADYWNISYRKNGTLHDFMND